MTGIDTEGKMKSKIIEQKKLIKKLKNTLRIYAPYMQFPDE